MQVHERAACTLLHPDSQPVFRPASHRSFPSQEAEMELLTGLAMTLCISLLIFRP
jgi:hypothetical protein